MDGRDLAETQAVLLKAARGLLAENPNFSVNTLLTRAEISRAEFRRCFTGKTALLAALRQEEIKDLSQILEAAQPAAQSLKSAVGAEMVAAPQTDAWLERRLRVFERALAALEKRQDQHEQTLAQRLGLMEEHMGLLTAAAAIARAAPQTDAPAEATPEPISEPLSEPAPEAKPETESTADLSPALLARVEEIADAGETSQPVSEEEMSAFLAQARLAAQKAATASAEAKPKPRRTRLLAVSGAALALLLLLGAGILFASGALGHAALASSAGGVTRRHVAHTGLPQIIALADSGDAAAQTVLALAYLRGQGVPDDSAAARRWSMAAAAQGQPVAEYLLGTFYFGDGAEQGEAVRWFEAAAKQGNVKAMHNLAVAYAKGAGVAQNMTEAAAWFTRAAQSGYRDSEFDLAVLYERGMGVPQNAGAALKWYLVAAAKGDAPSAARAATLETQMDAGEALKARQDAAGFVAQPMAGFANQAPAL